MNAAETTFSKILRVLRNPEKGIDILFCPEESGFSLDALDQDEVDEFINAMESTRLRVVAIPISLSCEGDVPKRLRKFLGVKESCSIGVVEQGMKHTVVFIPSALYKKRWGRNGFGRNVAIVH